MTNNRATLRRQLDEKHNTRVYIVIAGNYAEFMDWCFRWDVPPMHLASRNEPVRALYVTDTKVLSQIDGRGVKLVYTGSYYSNPVFGTEEEEALQARIRRSRGEGEKAIPRPKRFMGRLITSLENMKNWVLGRMKMIFR